MPCTKMIPLCLNTDAPALGATAPSSAALASAVKARRVSARRVRRLQGRICLMSLPLPPSTLGVSFSPRPYQNILAKCSEKHELLRRVGVAADQLALARRQSPRPPRRSGAYYIDNYHFNRYIWIDDELSAWLS